MVNKNKHLIQAYHQLQQKGENCVMATIIETFGSTYQKAGARLIITLDHELVGLLGGGCFERDLIEHACEVFESGQPKTVFYDMRSSLDVIWGLGLGCNGAVRILLELLKAETCFNPLDWIVNTAKGLTSDIIVSVYESIHPEYPAGSHYLWSGSEIGKMPLPEDVPFPFIGAAQRTIQTQKPRIETHVLNDQKIKVFYDILSPASYLLIIGAGVDAIPLVKYAMSLGWQVTLVDYRQEIVDQEKFQSADHLVCSVPEELNAKVNLNMFNALVLMTHNFEYDQRYLKAIASSSISYIGLLGPAQRRDRLLSALGPQVDLLIPRVFGPAGLDIGAETPEEIALSIMAGIHAELKGRDGSQLSPEIHLGTTECVDY